MSDRDPVLVAVDGSEPVTAAIQYAAQEAQRQGATLELVHVVPRHLPIAPMRGVSAADLDEMGHRILAAATERARSLLGPDRVTTSLRHGTRVSTLLELAEHARLVVLGAGQRPALERLLTGSTLTGVASRAKAPVVAVPATWVPGEERHRVVAGVKSTQHSPELIRRALEVATERDAGLVLVHAWELPGEYDDLVSGRVEQDEWRRRAEEMVQHSLEELREEFPTTPVEIRVVHGQPARALQAACEEADLLMLARRHRGVPLGHLGGTGRALLRAAPCPVQVVPPADVPVDLEGLVLERDGHVEK